MNHVWDVLHALLTFLTADRVIALLTLLVASIASVLTYLAPTRSDLKRVEDHVAATSHHLEHQSWREKLNDAASRVSISVDGQDFQDEPLVVHLRLQDPSVRLIRIDMLSESGTLYGGGSCEIQEPDHYIAELDCRKVANWFNAGQRNGNAMNLWLRVFMDFEEDGGGSKKMPVSLLPSQIGIQRKAGPVWNLSGEV